MLDFSDAFLKQLNSGGVSAETIEDCMQPVHKLNRQDLVRSIHYAINQHLSLKRQDLQSKMQSLSAPIDVSDAAYTCLKQDLDRIGTFTTNFAGMWPTDPVKLLGHVKSLIRDIPLTNQPEKDELSRKIEEAIEDAWHYQTYRQFKDREKWLATPYA